MLLPSLYGLESDGLLPGPLRIVATARTELDDDSFRARAAEALREHLPDGFFDEAVAARFLARLHYVPLDIGTPSDFERLGQAIGDPCRGVAIYLSTAPSLFKPAIEGLEAAGLACPTVRLALEKPLGTDLESSREINDAVAAAFPENRIFRIDHYLGKETVQNLLALRFANVLFEPLWNSAHIDHVQITVAETVGVETRGDYYDAAGALRDMVQNHMLQLLALVAMEPPGDFTASAVRDEKVKVLRSLRPITAADAEQLTVTGQYTRGAIDGQPVPGYAEEIGRQSRPRPLSRSRPMSTTGAGKACRSTCAPASACPSATPRSSSSSRTCLIRSSRRAAPPPGRTSWSSGFSRRRASSLRLMAKTPGLDREGVRLREIPLDIGLANAFSEYRRRIAYERLLLDLIEGDPTLFVRRDEVEAQWTWIDRHPRRMG